MQLDKHQLDAIYNLSETFKNHDIWNKNVARLYERLYNTINFLNNKLKTYLYK